MGKRVFLSASTAGGVTLTPPVSSGNLVQCIGDVVDVGGTYVTVDFRDGEQVVA